MIEINGQTITEDQWYALCNANGGRPCALADANLLKPWVYHRKYGIFPCNPAAHQQVMGLLYAWEHGFADAYDMMEAKKIRDLSKLADCFLGELQGTAFKSSVSDKVFGGKKGSLTMIEVRRLSEVGQIKYLMED